MAGESAANDVDEEVYCNDGAERHEAQEALAGDRRVIADADQAGQLDISGETNTARSLRTPEGDGPKGNLLLLLVWSKTL